MNFRTAAISFIAIATVVTSVPAAAHEMFVKAQEYVVAPNTDQVARLINGTFDKSENSIERDRMANVTVLANGQSTNPSNDKWHDDENSSYLNYRASGSGTYLIGVSTLPRIITMVPDDFVAYLKHDGVLDTLAEFEAKNTLESVRERYSKHVKAIVQVGSDRTDDYRNQLGYPVEIILDQNPADLKLGGELSFQVLFNGKPVANQLVRSSYEGFHGHDASGGHINSNEMRTDKEGRAKFPLNNKAVWYITLIHMQKIEDAEADYESNWATITFLVP